MQQYPLLQTKLYIPPIRPETVPRPKLVERLNTGLNRHLTLISAPAGFGKTTLVSEWVGSLRLDACRIAWLSLDEGDNDPARFLTYMITALRQIERVGITIGSEALGILQAPQPPPAEAVLTSLINDVAALPDRMVLVLDDYHLIEAPAIHHALNFLVEHLALPSWGVPPPGGMHLVIATREDPPLPLARLRARGQLTELRATDLRFSASEAAVFLNQAMGLALSAEESAALEARTEGWIAGLQLAALALQGLALQEAAPVPGHGDTASLIKSFTGSHRFVLDYLMEEVMEQQSDSVQAFLLQTAILDQMTGALCDALRLGPAESPTAQDSSQAILESLENANLFIVPLDAERRWYRYHRLFSDLLRQRLYQTQPERVPTLYHRASEWYEHNGFTDEAIEYALRSENFERAAHLIERVAEAVWVRGDDTRLRRWLDGLPVVLMSARPGLCIFHAWSLFATGQQGEAEQCLQVAEQSLEPSTDLDAETVQSEQDRPPGSDEMRLRGRVAATRAFFAFYRGDVPGISEYARRALEYLPEPDLAWRSAATNILGDAYDFKGEMAAAHQARLEALEVIKAAGNSYQIMIANLKLALILRHQGQLQRVIEICQQQMQLARERGMSQSVVTGWLLAIWGEALAELDDLDGAIDQARKGVELTEGGGEVAMLAWSYLCLTRVLFSRGDMTGAKEMVQKMESTAREYDIPPWIRNLMAAWQGWIWLAEDELDAASQWAQERGLDVAGELTYQREVEYMVLARLLIAQGRLDETARLLQRLLETVEPRGHIAREIEILNLQALAFQAGGETRRAMTALERALTLAKPGGFVRTFVDEGRPMAQLLYQAVANGITPDYAAKLLAAFETTDDRRSTSHRGESESSVVDGRSSVVHLPSSALVEPLSKRELEALQLIAEGLTNREIASRLFLSLNTVKAHLRNIYGKLDVHSRTQAIARAQSLGILPRR